MVRLAYVIGLGFACVIASWIAYKAWMNREKRGAWPLLGMALATILWAGGTFGLTLVLSPPAELRWLQFSYFGIVASPITFVLFALEYTGYEQYLTTSTVVTLLVLGGGFLGLVWTNPYHHLYWADLEYAVSVPAGVATTPAPGFWAFVVFTYLLLVTGSVLLVRYALTAPTLYRRQTIAVLGGVAVPWAANIPHVLQLMSADFTPIALSVTTVALWRAMSRYRLADLGPIALRTVFARIGSGIYVVDQEGRIVDLNAAGKELLGVTDEVVGTPFWECIPEHVRQRFRAVDDEEVVPVEGRTLAGDEGSDVYYYEVRETPVEVARGGQKGRLFVIDDVTERQRDRRQLKHQNEQLDKFTSVVSHDLRNPLNVAAGNLSLAKENDCDSDYLNHAGRALDRMETLIDDLLALAHGGTPIADPDPVDLATVVEEAWRTVETKQATLQVETDKEIIADRSRFHQLIENLVRNAVQHGGETVTVTAGDANGGFYVADDGPGIPPDERETVFDTGYSTSERGTGLGLSIVSDVAEAHGWEVQIGDGVEGGARFTFTGIEIVD